MLELVNAKNDISNDQKQYEMKGAPLVRGGELFFQLLDDGCLLVHLLQGSGCTLCWRLYFLECLNVRSVGHSAKGRPDDKLPTVPINFNRRGNHRERCD